MWSAEHRKLTMSPTPTELSKLAIEVTCLDDANHDKGSWHTYLLPRLGPAIAAIDAYKPLAQPKRALSA